MSEFLANATRDAYGIAATFADITRAEGLIRTDFEHNLVTESIANGMLLFIEHFAGHYPDSCHLVTAALDHFKAHNADLRQEYL